MSSLVARPFTIPFTFVSSVFRGSHTMVFVVFFCLFVCFFPLLFNLTHLGQDAVANN